MKMNRRFIKKPIEIEAFRFGYDSLPEWFANELNVSVWMQSTQDNRTIGCLIQSLEGRIMCLNGDYIIKGIMGEIYPCKEDIFLASYDEVNKPYIAKSSDSLLFDQKIWSQPGSIIPVIDNE